MYRQTTTTDPLHAPRTALRLSIAEAQERLAAVSDAPLLACEVPAPTDCTPVRQAELLDAVEDIARHAPLLACYAHNRWRAMTPPLDEAWVTAAPARCARVADAVMALAAQARVLASTVGAPLPDTLAQVDTLRAYAERYPALCAAERRLSEVYRPTLYDLDVPALAACLSASTPAWRRRLPGSAYAAALATVKDQAWPSQRPALSPEAIVRDVQGACAVAAARDGAAGGTAPTWAAFAALTAQLTALLSSRPDSADHLDLQATLSRMEAECDAVRRELGELGAALDLQGVCGDAEPVEGLSLTAVATGLRDLADHGADLMDLVQVERLRCHAAAEGLAPFLEVLLTQAALGAALTSQEIFRGFERCFYQRWLVDAA